MPRRSAPHAIAAVALVVTVAASGCAAGGAGSGPAGTPNPPAGSGAPATGAPTTSSAGGCPPTSGGQGVSIEYVDFVQVEGRQYIAGLTSVAAPSRADLGQVVIRVRCSFRQLNDRMQQETPRPRDGDAAFLPPGTAVYAIRGWSPRCRLAAEHDGQLQVYLAYRTGAAVATPEPCALKR